MGEYDAIILATKISSKYNVGTGEQDGGEWWSYYKVPVAENTIVTISGLQKGNAAWLKQAFINANGGIVSTFGYNESNGKKLVPSGAVMLYLNFDEHSSDTPKVQTKNLKILLENLASLITKSSAVDAN